MPRMIDIPMPHAVPQMTGARGQGTSAKAFRCEGPKAAGAEVRNVRRQVQELHSAQWERMGAWRKSACMPSAAAPLSPRSNGSRWHTRSGARKAREWPRSGTRRAGAVSACRL